MDHSVFSNAHLFSFQDNFNGECILYADVIEKRIRFGPISNCNYTIYTHVTLSIIYGSLLAALYTRAVYKKCVGSDSL